MRLIANGSFANSVRALIERSRMGRGAEAAGTLLLADAYDSAALLDAASTASSGRLATCFLTTRGVFVSCWLSTDGPCARCFDQRWLANLGLWEHDAFTEHTFQKLERASPGVRCFAVPESAVAIASAATIAVIHGTSGDGICSYIDLVTCRISSGRLYAVHNCPCHPATRQGPARGRYTRGLAESLPAPFPGARGA